MPTGTDTGMLMTLTLANGESALRRQQSEDLINTSSGRGPLEVFTAQWQQRRAIDDVLNSLASSENLPP